MGSAVETNQHLTESSAHSFVVKVWCEDSPQDSEQGPAWRGKITHVVSGRQGYVTSCGELAAFITTFLTGRKTELPMLCRLCQRLVGFPS